MRKLTHYLRQERRRAGLSQEDIAFLLGARARQHVHRYESGMHLPPLRAALCYEAIFRKPVAYLFAGTYSAIAKDLARRAKDRRRHVGLQRQSVKNTRRDWSLQAIIQSHEA